MRYTEFAQSALRRVGFDISRWPKRPDGLAVNWAMKYLIETQGINCILDVGANQGQFGQLLRSLGYRGRIVSFEPSPGPFQAVSRLASDDHSWQVRQIGLAAKPGTAELYIYGESQLNSLHPPLMEHAELPDVIREMAGYANTGAVTVTLSTLSDEYEKSVAGISSPKVLLKSDTQGHDLEVIAGAQGLPQQVIAVLVELSVQPIYEEQPYLTRVMDRLKDEDFIPIAFQPVSVSFDNLRVVEFDGLFMRQHST